MTNMLGQAFANKIIEYCSDDVHGYSQTNRWGPDYDCSSLVYQVAYDLAPYYPALQNIPTSGTRYTGTIISDFCNKAGWGCMSVPSDYHDIPIGSLCLNVVNHVMTYTSDGVLSGARLDQDDRSGDSSGTELESQTYYNYPWDYIITPPTAGGTYYGDTLSVDGYWGNNTTAALQSWLYRWVPEYTQDDIVIDGMVSNQYPDTQADNPGLTGGWDWNYTLAGSCCIRAFQRFLKANSPADPGSIDGLMGPATICSMQYLFNTYADGCLWECSPAIKALQEFLNNVRG